VAHGVWSEPHFFFSPRPGMYRQVRPIQRKLLSSKLSRILCRTSSVSFYSSALHDLRMMEDEGRIIFFCRHQVPMYSPVTTSEYFTLPSLAQIQYNEDTMILSLLSSSMSTFNYPPRPLRQDVLWPALVYYPEFNVPRSFPRRV